MLRSVLMCVFVYPIFQFTFASNAATVLGGVLVTNQYKLRLPAAFLSAFCISVGTISTLFLLTPSDILHIS